MKGLSVPISYFSKLLKTASPLIKALKSKLYGISNRTIQSRFNRDRRFSAVLMTTIVSLVTVSVVVVLIVLNEFLGERVPGADAERFRYPL